VPHLRYAASFLSITLLTLRCIAQEPTIQERINALIAPSTGSWTTEQIATMRRIRDASLASPYALDTLRQLTYTIGPRLAGSAQAAHAVEFVAQQMRAAGADVRFESVEVPHWVRGIETGEIVDWPGQPPRAKQPIVLTALGGSVATAPEGLTAGLLVVNSFPDLKNLPDGSLKGRIVLFNYLFDKQLAESGHSLAAYEHAVVYRSAAPIVAGSLGAAAVLVRSVGSADYRLPHTGATYYVPNIPRIPAAAVTAEDARLLASLAAQGAVRVHITLTPQSLPRTQSHNVIADWKGREHPEEIVLVSGHLDSWDLGAGALDDGVGIAISMQVIRTLHALGVHPKRTIRFVAWMNEELGLDGSRAYVSAHAAEFPNHVAAIESDLGSGHPRGFTYVGKPEIGEWLQPLAPVLDPLGATTFARGTEAGSDIAALSEKGIPGFAPTVDDRRYFDYHHTAADTFDKVNPRELSENCALVAVLAYALADSSTKPPR